MRMDIIHINKYYLEQKSVKEMRTALEEGLKRRAPKPKKNLCRLNLEKLYGPLVRMAGHPLHTSTRYFIAIPYTHKYTHTHTLTHTHHPTTGGLIFVFSHSS